MNIVKAAQRISIRDYSNYDPEKCHDGGCYAVGMDFYRHPSGWECKRKVQDLLLEYLKNQEIEDE